MKNDLVSRMETAIRTAIGDYGRHTDIKENIDSMSDTFVRRLAADAVAAKCDLRNLFSKSPAWNEDLQAIVINGNRTADPDYGKVAELSSEILETSDLPRSERDAVMRFVTAYTETYDYGILDDYEMFDAKISKNPGLRIIQDRAPKAYTKGKKPSKFFMALCKALGIANQESGSDFQKRYAKLADEMSSRKIDYKLFVSINPAHFLTMSNPLGDDRGQMLVSCHSLNRADYPYNAGAIGYARDNTSFIVFTVADPAVPETLNNRKTSREIFAYRPGSGLLLQSRLYDANGNTGEKEVQDEYRHLIQREISDLENVPNMWDRPLDSWNTGAKFVCAGRDFGGYQDWTYSHMNGIVTMRNDCDSANVLPLIVGAAGLCIECGEETNECGGLFCDGCGDYEICADCGCRIYPDYDDSVYVEWYGRVCQECLETDFAWCDMCETYHPIDDMIEVHSDGYTDYVCTTCANRYATQCDDCGKWYLEQFTSFEMVGEECVCEHCLESGKYVTCHECGEYTEVCDAHFVDDEPMCDSCYVSEIENGTIAECAECYEAHYTSDMVGIDGAYYCSGCAPGVQTESTEHTAAA